MNKRTTPNSPPVSPEIECIHLAAPQNVRFGREASNIGNERPAVRQGWLGGQYSTDAEGALHRYVLTMINQKGAAIILLNGESSAGKSTLAQAVQVQLETPFLRFSPDLLLFGSGVLPARRDFDGPFSWAAMRGPLFEGYFRCLAALAGAGNDVVADLVIERKDQLRRLVSLLLPYDVFFVGVRCPLPELERRERLRGDRKIGDARQDHATVHSFSAYDAEVDSTLPPEHNAATLAEAWRVRPRLGVFGKLAALYAEEATQPRKP